MGFLSKLFRKSHSAIPSSCPIIVPTPNCASSVKSYRLSAAQREKITLNLERGCQQAAGKYGGRVVVTDLPGGGVVALGRGAENATVMSVNGHAVMVAGDGEAEVTFEPN